MEILRTLIYLLNEMSPYILLGFLFAGLLHAFVPQRLMSRHLAGTGWRSVVKAALIGVPLPLCSCGVLPTAVSLRRSGASRASASSFLIATPQTGVDSIAATYSLLGPAFAVVRPVAALTTAVAGGIMVGRHERKLQPEAVTSACAVPDSSAPEPSLSFYGRLKSALHYGFYQMVQSIGKWLVLGLIIAAAITVFVPEGFFTSLAEYPIVAMLAVVAVSVPMYVCATGSIPIALSLMLKGLSPGTAVVLLMAGPAANFASVTVISRTMGKGSAAIYLLSIIAGAIGFGLLIDYLLPARWFTLHQASASMACHTPLSWFDTICSAILIVLLAVAFAPRLKKSQLKSSDDMNKEYKIKGMACAHCKATVEKNLATLDGVTGVEVDLSRGVATVQGEHDAGQAVAMIRSLGFEPVEG